MYVQSAKSHDADSRSYWIFTIFVDFDAMITRQILRNELALVFVRVDLDIVVKLDRIWMCERLQQAETKITSSLLYND